MRDVQIPIVFPTDTGFSSGGRDPNLLRGKGREILQLIRQNPGVNRGTLNIAPDGKMSLKDTKDDEQVRKHYLDIFKDTDNVHSNKAHVRPIFDAYKGESVTAEQLKTYQQAVAAGVVLDALNRAVKRSGRITPVGVYIPRVKGRSLASVLFSTDDEHGWSYTYDNGRFLREGTQADTM